MLAKPFELPKKSEIKKRASKVPLDDASFTHMVAAADATADSTMDREYVINTNTTNYRMGKVLPDTGTTSSSFVGAEKAGRIESVEPKFPSDCYLSTNEHHQPTTISLTAWTV